LSWRDSTLHPPRRDSSPAGLASSAHNRFVGLVTGIQTDAVTAQVELQCGPFRVVSLLSSEAVRDLGLQPGTVP